MADKHNAAYHPHMFTCESCGKAWGSPTVADDCCGPWLGDLDDDRGYN